MTDSECLSQLLQGEHGCIMISTTEEEHARDVVRAAVDDLGYSLFMWTSVRGVFDATFEDSKPVEDTEHAAAGLYHLSQAIHSKIVCVAVDLIDHLADARSLRAFRELVHRVREVGSAVILIDHAATIPPIVRAESTMFELSLPGDDEIEEILRRTVRSHHREAEVDVKLKKTHLQTIIRNLAGLTRRHCRQLVTDTIAVDRTFDEADINHILAEKRRLIHQDGLLEYIETPVDLSDIGGLVHLKKWLKHREQAFDDKAREFGLTAPRGVLMLGVQGAGKSLCAKAIATAWHRPLMRLDPSVLYDRYIGESERRLREALSMAQMMAPIVLWIDEIEKGFASAATQSNDGGLSKRMFGTLLTWMQEHEAPVFMVATANDIEALPPELLRKGRFDEIFFVDLPDQETRAVIFAIHLRKRGREPETFDVDALARAADGFSGAEIEQAVIGALHEAFATDQELTTGLLVKAVEASPPLSVTMSEKVAGLQAWAKGRTVAAG